jgi:hypothetical protein
MQEAKAVPTLGRRSGCLAGGRRRARPDLLQRCVWRAPGQARGRVVLVGDSHADSLSNGVVTAANALGYDVLAVTASSCSFTARAPSETVEVRNCGDLHTWLLDEIRTSRPALVVVSHYDAIKAGRGSAGLEKWTADLATSLRQINDAGTRALVVGDIPSIGELNGDPCRFGLFTKPRCSVSRSDVERRQGAARRAVAATVRKVPGTTYLDLTSSFCDARRCSAIRGGVLAYADAQHLDGRGSAMLAPMLRQAIAGAIRS